nr:gustatory receptor 24.1 [Papilio memnon]
MKIKQHATIDSVSTRIVQGMRSLLCIEYFYGIFRCRLRSRSSEAIDLRMKFISVAVASVWLTFFFSSVIPCLVEMFKDVDSAIEHMGWIVTAFQYAGTVILLVFWQAQKNQKVIELFAKIDMSLHVGVNQNFYKASLFQCKKLLLIYVFFCVTLIAAYIYYFTQNIIIGNVTYLIVYAERKIEIMVYCQFLFMIKQRLFLIRDYLSKIRFNRHNTMFVQNSEPNVDVNFIGHISTNNFRIRDLVSLYCKIGKLCNTINDVFNYLMLMTLSIAFFVILSNVWVSLYYSKFSQDILVSVPLLLSILTELFFVILFAYNCGNITIARNELKYSLYEITKNNDLPSSMRTQAEVFLDLIKVWPMSIYVFNMFEMNLKLVLKFISIASTYVILVVQINHLFNSNKTTQLL